MLKVLNSEVRKRRGGEARYRGFKITELSLFAQDMTTYVENSEENTKAHLELIGV